MAEIASSYPTAGGLYFWSSKLGNPGWGWYTGIAGGFGPNGLALAGGPVHAIHVDRDSHKKIIVGKAGHASLKSLKLI